MSAKHNLDVVSLGVGLVFLAAAAFWGVSDRASLPGRDWYLPVLLIAVGVVGLLSARTGRPRRNEDELHY